MQDNQTESKWILWVEWGVLIAIMILATFLRYWRIEEVPPGFNSDEAVGAIGALKTLREGISYSYEGQGGGGVLGFYFAAAFFYLFGPSIATIRGLAAWASLVGLFAHYWAVREIFRTSATNNYLFQARLIAAISTLGLAVSLWHIQASRVAFAGIGVPFLMLPSIYFLWHGLNHPDNDNNPKSIIKNLKSKWPFILSGFFLGGLMYIYLSGAFAPALYAAFFIGQWLLVLIINRGKQGQSPLSGEEKPEARGHLAPPLAYLTTQFWRIFATALTAIILLLPIVYVVLNSPSDEPGITRVSQASFLNPNINQGDPWGLLQRSIIGNFSAFGISFSWLTGQLPARLVLPPAVGLLVFLGFLISLWRGLRGQAAYLFVTLWFVIMLLPSILSPDSIPHTLRAIGATSPTYIFAAIFIVELFKGIGFLGRRWLPSLLGETRSTWLVRGVGVLIALALIVFLWQVTANRLFQYFYIFPNTNDAKAAYHVYAIEMAEEINREPRPEVAFILPRNTAAGDINQNFSTDFIVELAQPPASHYWVTDDERTLAANLTEAASDHSIIRVVTWKTSKHTGADPKEVIPYYLEKFGHYVGTDSFEYFDIATYQLETPTPDFAGAERLQSIDLNFGGQLSLNDYALGNAGDATQVSQPQAYSNDLLWLRLDWQKTSDHPEDLKVSALLYADNGQLVTQMDKLLVSNFLQVSSTQWAINDHEATYFLLPIPAATPPGQYQLRIAVYGAESLNRLPVGATNLEIRGEAVSLNDVTILPAKKPVELNPAEMALPTNLELQPGLTLLGFETLPGDSVYAGNDVRASLLWTATTPQPEDVTMALLVETLENNESTPISKPVGLAGSGYPTSQWQTGEILRGWLKARIPPSLEPGTYILNLQLATADGSELLTHPIGEFQIEGWSRNFDPPTPQIAMEANFNAQARLIGLDVGANQLVPGETLIARLYWQVTAEFEQNYTAFIHLIGPDGQLYGQMDHIPGNGTYPTTGWLTGEYIADEYAIAIAPNAPSGDYRLAIGLYQSETGERLTLNEVACPTIDCQAGDNAVQLAGLVIE